MWQNQWCENFRQSNLSKIGGRNLEAIEVHQGESSFGVVCGARMTQENDRTHSHFDLKTLTSFALALSSSQIDPDRSRLFMKFMNLGSPKTSDAFDPSNLSGFGRTRSPSTTSFKGPASPAVAPTRQGKWLLGDGVHGRWRIHVDTSAIFRKDIRFWTQIGELIGYPWGPWQHGTAVVFELDWIMSFKVKAGQKSQLFKMKYKRWAQFFGNFEYEARCEVAGIGIDNLLIDWIGSRWFYSVLVSTPVSLSQLFCRQVTWS